MTCPAGKHVAKVFDKRACTAPLILLVGVDGPVFEAQRLEPIRLPDDDVLFLRLRDEYPLLVAASE